MRRGLGTAVVVVTLGLAGCTLGATPRNTAGQVTTSASVDAFQIRVGDCTGKLAEGNISNLEIVPCADSHYYEAYSRTDLEDGDFPGETSVTKAADKFCTAEFKKFVGVSTDDSKYDMFYLYPTAESWRTGDREILCLAGSDDGKVKGSLKGVKK